MQMCISSSLLILVLQELHFLGYYAASSGNFFTDVSGQPIGPIF